MKAELLILGVLHRGNFHPYEIKRRLQNAMIECYTDVDVGTLYYAIRQLEKSGFIAAVRRGARSSRRDAHRIRNFGRRQAAVSAASERAVRRSGTGRPNALRPMLFLQFSNLPLIADLLRTRIERETESIREIAKIRKQLGSIPATGALHLMKHLELQHRLDRKWLQGVLADVKGGRVRDVADRERLTRGSLASKTRRRPHSSGAARGLK